MLAENISNYSGSSGYSSSGDFGFGTGSAPIDLGTVEIHGQRTGSSGSTFTGEMNYGTGYSSNSGNSSWGGYHNGGYDSNGSSSNGSGEYSSNGGGLIASGRPGKNSWDITLTMNNCLGTAATHAQAAATSLRLEAAVNLAKGAKAFAVIDVYGNVKEIFDEN